MWMQPPSPPVARDLAAAVPAEAPLGDKLKTYYDRLSSEPVPDGLARLTEALEAAFERGELRCNGVRRPA